MRHTLTYAMNILYFRGETGDSGIYQIATFPYLEASDDKKEKEDGEGEGGAMGMRRRSKN